MTNEPTNTPPAHDPANSTLSVGAEDFANKVHDFWEKNRSLIFIFIAAVIFSLLAAEGWEWYQADRERGVQQAYAKLGDGTEGLQKFAAANSGHALAGAALLRLADAAYTKDDFRTAATTYAKAEATLAHTALRSRARLGAAMSQLAAGDRAPAEAALKALGNDTKAVAAIRAEASYHLATLLHEAGKNEEAKLVIAEITKIDSTGLWAQRGFMLRTQLEGPAAPAAPAGDLGIQFKAGGK
ncbi:MAG: tetratricopeptide repeat protein [Candidatus Didemnitutus sp.]|nr:tetratricopeptide repeat protein [Candidatus Didemnitutus sp.]